MRFYHSSSSNRVFGSALAQRPSQHLCRKRLLARVRVSACVFAPMWLYTTHCLVDGIRSLCRSEVLLRNIGPSEDIFAKGTWLATKAAH